MARLALGLTTTSAPAMMVLVCERMHWTYEDYLAQPQWLINGLLAHWNEQSEAARKKK